MTKIISLITILCLVCICTTKAQNALHAINILDKTSKVLGNKDGACAKFTMSSNNMEKLNGTISIKGNKFHAKTHQAIVWFDGKTQWAYIPYNEEVNITTPTLSQRQMMNPYTFIDIYKNGYNINMKSNGNNYEIHLTSQATSKDIQEMFITINKKTYIPSLVKIKQNHNWSTINIHHFQTKKLSDKLFVFSSKDYPNAELIDLR